MTEDKKEYEIYEVQDSLIGCNRCIFVGVGECAGDGNGISTPNCIKEAAAAGIPPMRAAFRWKQEAAWPPEDLDTQ